MDKLAPRTRKEEYDFEMIKLLREINDKLNNLTVKEDAVAESFIEDVEEMIQEEERTKEELEGKTVKELHEICKDLELTGYSRKTKDELIEMIIG